MRKEGKSMEIHLDRKELHVLLDRIPDSDIETARKFLRALADPVEVALRNAPTDDAQDRYRFRTGDYRVFFRSRRMIASMS
jgi:hypothetical protein